MAARNPAIGSSQGARAFFDVQQREQMLVVTPVVDLQGLPFDQFELQVDGLAEQARSPTIAAIIFDFGRTSRAGSKYLLALLARVWRRVREHHGMVAVCNPSSDEMRVLRVTSLDRLCPIYATLIDAMQDIRNRQRPR